MPASSAETATPLDRPLPVLSWAMYDFANTIYSAIVVTAFFPQFMRRIIGQDIYTGATLTLSMVLSAFIVPLAGAIADRTGRGMRYLWWLTVACCAATAGIGLVANDAHYSAGPLAGSQHPGQAAPLGVAAAALLFFAIANLTYQVSLVFYNALLPVVASPERQGRVSGLGVGLGYFGVVIALPIAHFAFKKVGAMWVTFVIAGVAFFVTALPCFLFVRTPRPTTRTKVTGRVFAEQFGELRATLRTLWHMPPVLFFFIGNFLCVDVVNTLIMWTRPYLDDPQKGLGWATAVGVPSDDSIKVLMGMSVTAFILGMGMGWLTDKLGAKRTLLAAAGSMMLCILTVASTRNRAVIIPVVLFFGSGGLAGVWVAGRKFLLDVAPKEKVGEFFGLYGVTTKLSVVGCTVFAALGDWTGSYRVALLAQLVLLVPGIAFLAISRAERVSGAPPREETQ